MRELKERLKTLFIEPAKKTTRWMILSLIVSPLIFQVVSAIKGISRRFAYHSREMYANTKKHINLGYKGYVIYEREFGPNILLNSRGKPIWRASSFYPWEKPTDCDSLLMYVDGGYYGFLNLNTEKDAIPASNKRFLYAWHFDSNSGLAAVEDANLRKIGFINPQGVYVIPPQYECVQVHNYLFEDGDCVMYNADGSYMLIDTKGNVLLRELEEISHKHKGHRLIKLNGKVGLWKDKIVLPIEFDEIILKDKNIELAQGNRRWSVAYDYSTIEEPFIFDFVSPLRYEFSSSLSESRDVQYVHTDKMQDLVICGLSGYEGVFNVKLQKIVIPIEWDSIDMIRYGYNKYALFGRKEDRYIPLKL